MVISVTQDDIDRGNTNNGEACPVALATKRAYETNAVFVTLYDARIKCEHHSLPIMVSEFILRFDAGSRVHPLEFELGP